MRQPVQTGEPLVPPDHAALTDGASDGEHSAAPEAETELPQPTRGHAQDPSDVSLVKAYLDGDAGAFDTLFSRYHARVRAVAMRYVGDEHAAEDLVQETFLNVIRALTRVDSTFNFGAWVHRIAVNICQDELRRRGRRAAHVDTSSNDPEDALLRIADSDRHNSPEDALEATYLRQLVWEVAKKLPERQRMVLTLRELQGLSYASIAHVMGISDAAVETLLHRARKRFKEEYLLLESPAEERPACTSLAYLLTTVGRANLRPDQRKLVVEHLETCALCQAQFMPDGAEAAASWAEPELSQTGG
jgi:RNA polymerase sigma-70 factor (ECF subfamily)